MLILVKLSNCLYISLNAVLPTRFVIEPINSFFFVTSHSKKFVLSMVICTFAVSVLAKPLNNAQIVRGVFCLYTFEHGEPYPFYKTI